MRDALATGDFRVAFRLFFKASSRVRSLSYGNSFIHMYMNQNLRMNKIPYEGLALKQRRNATRKSPINFSVM